MLARLLLLTFTLSACAGGTDDDTDTPADTDETDVATTGRLAIRFTIDPFVEESLGDGETPVGRFEGSVWNADDVTAIGPDDDAVDLEGLSADMDLVAQDPSDVLITTGELAVGYVRILGFLDTDDNRVEESPNPDNGDPVTLPEQNEFEVIGGETTEITVKFGLLNP